MRLTGNCHSTAKLYRGIKFRPDIKLTMEKDTFIGDNCSILVSELTMKRGSQICAGTVISGREPVTLEENVVIGYNCVILSSSDSPRGEFMNDASPENRRKIKQGPIILRKNCFISSLAFIGPNVTVGERTIVGIHACVIDSLPSDHLFFPSQLRFHLKQREMKRLTNINNKGKGRLT